jgi:O-antigen/teichoic acid export membrane protein
MSVARNIIANYIGQAWRVFILLLFVPLYLSYLGAEAYGLIGIFATLQAWLGLLDLGMKPTVTREMARFSAKQNAVRKIRDLLRSAELLAVIVGLCVFLAVWAASGALAERWVRATELRTGEIARSFTLMGLIIALRFLESIYSGSLLGMQRQVVLNVVGVVMQTVQAGGAVVLLALVSPTIEVFFLWQAGVSLATTVAVGFIVYKGLPPTTEPARFSWHALASVWRFAAGMAGITLTSLLLTQIDKVLLSHWLPLEVFAHYTLASLVASGLDLFTGPIAIAVFPYFVALAAEPAQYERLKEVYHKSAQLVTALAAAVAAVLAINSEDTLIIWTGDHAMSQRVAPIMALMVLGTLLHCMMWIPYQLQLARGWTRLSLGTNVVAALVLVPTLFVVVPVYGAIGAAWVWIALNTGYVLVTIQLMHRVLLKEEKWRWYAEDVFFPLAVAFGVAWICKHSAPPVLGRFEIAATLAASLVVTLCCSVLASPHLRKAAARSLSSKFEMARK